MRIRPTILVSALMFASCADGAPAVSNGTGGAGNTSSPDTHDVSHAKAPPGCGDGTLTDDEACDDGNRKDGDGCSGNCLTEDPGYLCYPPGVACHAFARCGDGIQARSELCDDGNVLDGDGCSAHCTLELGFKCDGQPSKCSATTCGDRKREGAESCDD